MRRHTTYGSATVDMTLRIVVRCTVALWSGSRMFHLNNGAGFTVTVSRSCKMQREQVVAVNYSSYATSLFDASRLVDTLFWRTTVGPDASILCAKACTRSTYYTELVSRLML